jgi:hypothetical protein
VTDRSPPALSGESGAATRDNDLAFPTSRRPDRAGTSRPGRRLLGLELRDDRAHAAPPEVVPHGPARVALVAHDLPRPQLGPTGIPAFGRPLPGQLAEGGLLVALARRKHEPRRPAATVAADVQLAAEAAARGGQRLAEPPPSRPAKQRCATARRGGAPPTAPSGSSGRTGSPRSARGRSAPVFRVTARPSCRARVGRRSRGGGPSAVDPCRISEGAAGAGSTRGR